MNASRSRCLALVLFAAFNAPLVTPPAVAALHKRVGFADRLEADCERAIELDPSLKR